MDEPEADEADGEEVEAGEDVEASLLANGKPAEAAEPGERAFHHPSMATQPAARLDAASSDPGDDPAPAQDATAVGEVVALVGVQLSRSLPRPTIALPDRWYRLDQQPSRLGPTREAGHLWARQAPSVAAV